MRYLLALAIAFTLTVVWQTISLEDHANNLQRVEHEEAVTLPADATKA